MRENSITRGAGVKLPNLKLVITSGMWNASRFSALKKETRSCGTDTRIHSTAKLTWALIMNSWEDTN